MQVSQMQAIFALGYGTPDVLKVRNVSKPVPNENEIRIKIRATPVTAADTFIRKGTPLYGRLFIGLLKPKQPIPGTGFSGIVDAVGSKVSRFQIGDAVFGETALGFGAHAEYLCIPEDGVVLKKPDNVDFQEAATICDGVLTSWNFLTKVEQVKAGQKVLINGASGSLGTAAVQLAKKLGAEVYGVCGPDNIELVKSLGAKEVFNYRETNIAKLNKKFDVIFDTVGKLSFSQCKKILPPNGVYMSPVLSIPLLGQMIWTSIFKGKKAKFSATGLLEIPLLRSMLQEIKEMLQTGALKIVIDKTYRLEQISEAHQYVDTGHKKGNVLIQI